jgi:hypothetical protein
VIAGRPTPLEGTYRRIGTADSSAGQMDAGTQIARF